MQNGDATLSPINFRGLLIGNGRLSNKWNVRFIRRPTSIFPTSYILACSSWRFYVLPRKVQQRVSDFDWSAFNELKIFREWITLRQCCQPQNTIYCNITSYLLPDGESNGNNKTCGDLASRLATQRQHHSSLDLYNMYQDCYGFSSKSFGSQSAHISENAKYFKNHRFSAKAAFVSQFVSVLLKTVFFNERKAL